MDEITWSKEDGYRRKSNNLGGFEGGMTNGQPIVVRGVMKPIPTLYKPLILKHTNHIRPVLNVRTQQLFPLLQ